MLNRGCFADSIRLGRHFGFSAQKCGRKIGNSAILYFLFFPRRGLGGFLRRGLAGGREGWAALLRMGGVRVCRGSCDALKKAHKRVATAGTPFSGLMPFIK